jgi:quinol monooxygenase YgiN
MYGTVAKVRVKAGQLDAFKQLMSSDEMNGIAGLVGTNVYQMDADANTLIMAVAFTDKDAYVKNAQSPEMNARYEKMVALLEGAPEWNDGEIIFAGMK